MKALNFRLAPILALALLAAPAAVLVAGDAKPAKSAAELEKEKALANPYPNDLGPDKLTEEELKAYTPAQKEGYQLLLQRCAQCHAPSRPLNSRFVEPAGKDAAVAALKKSNPELFKEPYYVRQIEGAVWNRYVKRMMAKPGCKISQAEGKKIWEFLVADSDKRKLGANAAKWSAHRKKLVEDFKKKHPARYKQLEHEKDL